MIQGRGKRARSEERKKPASFGRFFALLRKKQILETLGAFIAGGWLILEVVHWILVDHYHFPEGSIDITLVLIIGALLGTLVWKWFGSTGKRLGNVRIEVLLVPLIILATIAIAAILGADIAGLQAPRMIILIVAGCLAVAWIIFKSLQWAIRSPVTGAGNAAARGDRPPEPREEKNEEHGWKESIVVLPFRNMSADPEQEYFCEGLAEEIINALTKIQELRVVARTSAFFFKGKDTDIRDIGRALNVKTVLEGSVRKSGSRLRITAQLISVDDGFHLWSDRFDRELSDIFIIQDEITLAVVANLKLKLLKEETAAVTKRYTKNLAAYNLSLKGRYFADTLVKNNFETAISYFIQAIAEDPDYGAAYAGIAKCYSLMGFFHHLPAIEAFPKAREAALKALNIDENLSEAHSALGLVHMYYDWDWIGAESAFRKALKLNPNSDSIITEYAEFLMIQGKIEEGFLEAKRSLDLNPLSLSANLNVGFFHLRTGQPEKAKEQLEKALEINPGHPLAVWLIGQTMILGSKYEEGLREIEKAVVLSQNNTMILAGLGWAYAVAGKEKEARQVLKDLDEKARREYPRPYLHAKIYCALGEKENALDWLEKAFKYHDVSIVTLASDETLAGLRAEPRFMEILKKMQLR